MGTSTIRQQQLSHCPPDSAVAGLLQRLIATGIIPPDDYEALNPAHRHALATAPTVVELLELLMQFQLMTEFQSERLRAAQIHGLVLGNYRLLDQLGEGGMGTVYRAEHRQLRTPVAIKALHTMPELHPRTLARLFMEVRAVSRLRHRHVVTVIDAGEEPARGPNAPAIAYFVMELVPGTDLQRLAAVEPLPVGLACQVAYQIADALMEAHRLGLIHRDIKPSNVMVTPEGQAKLLDFGLARIPGDNRLPQTGATLGTVGYMAPELSRNAHPVDARTDIFGLGCTLYYALTGQAPFADALATLGPPPSIRGVRPEVPPGLDAIVSRMMAADPQQRYANAEVVMRSLWPFIPQTATPSPSSLRSIVRPLPVPPTTQTPPPAASVEPREHSRAVAPPPNTAPARILIVDDQPDIRRLCRTALSAEGLLCDEAADGPTAVELAARKAYDLIVLDVDLPGFSGEEVLCRLRQNPPTRHLKVVMFSGATSGDDLSRILLAGADDFVTKPFSIIQLRARIKTALRLKEAQDRADVLNSGLLTVNAELEHLIEARDGALIQARNALVLALAKLVEHRSSETGPHLIRVQRYCRVLAEEAAMLPAFAPVIDSHWIRTLQDAAPLHDIGKAALPDHILNKPGPLEPNERLTMQTHTTIGAETLREVAQQHPFATAFLQTAVDIARHHHERWDGTGYPDRLAGEAIPLVARLVAIADVYDALRSRRVYKPELSHSTTVMTITDGSPGHFDPALLEVFRKVAPQFDRIFRELGE